jgi:folylpolyglutamate synthase/dihydropteroate synthase
MNSRIDLCLIVIEKKERVDNSTVLAFELLDLTIEKMKANNLVIVFNKATKEDDFESVLEFYAEAYEQANCVNMPKPDEVKEENVLLLFRQEMGNKKLPMEKCVKEATALFDYTQKNVV